MNVKTIQEFLKGQGFNPGPIDGISGPKTQGAAHSLYKALVAVETGPQPPHDASDVIKFKKPKRRVDRVFIHCSASDNPKHDNVATMRRWHLDRGWSDVGYHMFIRKDGTLENGRSIESTPAAQKGHNAGTIAICLHGLDEDKFTEAQFKTLRALCASINEAYGGKVTFHGHREVAAKSCPVFDYKSVLNLDEKGAIR